MSKPDMKAALRSVSRSDSGDRFDMTAARMVSTRERSGLLDLPVEQVHPNPDQPRRTFDAEGLQELAASLQALGMLQPIVVRRHGENGYMIVAGERRWRAAQIAGFATVPAVVRALDDNATLEAALTENLQRADLAPLEEAYLLQRMVEEMGYSIRGLAERLGKGKGYVEDRLRLTRMDPELQVMVSGRPDTLTHARELEKVQNAEERAALVAQVQEQALPLQELRRRVRRVLAPDAAAHAPQPQRTPAAAAGAASTTPPSSEEALLAGSLEQVSGRPDTLATSVSIEQPDVPLNSLPADPVAMLGMVRTLDLARCLRHRIGAQVASASVVEPLLAQELRALAIALQHALQRLEGQGTTEGED